MVETMDFDLAALQDILKKPFEFRPGSFRTLISEISVSPEVITAIRTGELSVVSDIVGPGDFSVALFAPERD